MDKRDDFAWMLELMRRGSLGPAKGRAGGQGYETAEQIYERRMKRRNRLKTIIALLLQLAIPLIIFLFLL